MEENPNEKITETEKELMDCLEFHQLNLVTAVKITLMLMDNEIGQRKLIECLKMNPKMTENEIWKKTAELEED